MTNRIAAFIIIDVAKRNGVTVALQTLTLPVGVQIPFPLPLFTNKQLCAHPPDLVPVGKYYPVKRVYCGHNYVCVRIFFAVTRVLRVNRKPKFSYQKGCSGIAQRDSAKDMTRINGMIHAREVRVITETGEQLGIMSSREALEAAEERNLDLVEIAPQAKPPVCKIMDYGKYRFERQKQQKEQKKRQHQIEIKEIQLSLNIDTHDIETKSNHAKKFLQQGNKVKVSIRFRGREMAHPERCVEIMAKFYDIVSAEVNCVIEKPAKLEGRTMIMFLAPKPNK